MRLAEEVTFFNKGAILKELDNIPENAHLELDIRKTTYLDHDIIEILDNFAIKSREKDINFTVISERGIVENPGRLKDFFQLPKK